VTEAIADESSDEADEAEEAAVEAAPLGRESVTPAALQIP